MGAGVGQALRLGSIEITESGVSERTREGHRLVFVPRAEIERVTVAEGFTSERPIATLVGALICLGGAAVMAWTSIKSIYNWDGYVIVTPIVLLGVIGAALLHTLIRRGRYLRLDTPHGPRKLIFDGVSDIYVAREVVRMASSQWGYIVELPSRDEAEPIQR